MTAYIDSITIVGTPEEIQEFIELREQFVREKFNPPYLPNETYSIPAYSDLTKDTTTGEYNFLNHNVEFNT